MSKITNKQQYEPAGITVNHLAQIKIILDGLFSEADLEPRYTGDIHKQLPATVFELHTEKKKFTLDIQPEKMGANSFETLIRLGKLIKGWQDAGFALKAEQGGVLNDENVSAVNESLQKNETVNVAGAALSMKDGRLQVDIPLEGTPFAITQKLTELARQRLAEKMTGAGVEFTRGQRMSARTGGVFKG